MGKDLTDLGFSDGQWNELAEETDKWIPSELENLVKQARDVGFEARGIAIPTFDETIALVVAQKTAILSFQKKDQLEALRTLCRNAKPVDLPEGEEVELISVASAGKRGTKKTRALGDMD